MTALLASQGDLESNLSVHIRHIPKKNWHRVLGVGDRHTPSDSVMETSAATRD